MKCKHLLLLLTGLFFLNGAMAQTWKGTTSTDWNTASNWSTNAVPIATGNVNIPGNLSKYPKLANDVAINSMNLQAKTQIDFNGFSLSTTNTGAATVFSGTLNNSDASKDIVININTGTSTNGTTLQGAAINDNITFNLSGAAAFGDATAGGPSGNNFSGDVTININTTGYLQMSHGDTSTYRGNVTINRTGKGVTQIFSAGAIIAGNFTFSNTASGNNYIGNDLRLTSVGGKVNITINDTAVHTLPGAFRLQRIVNQTSGGSINVQNTQGYWLKSDTLNVNAISITGYRGPVNGDLEDNEITGKVTISNDASHTGANGIRGNHIMGTSKFSSNSSSSFLEANLPYSGNTYSGNVTFETSGALIQIGNGDTSKFGGDLILNSASGISLNKIRFIGSTDGMITQIGTQPIIIPRLIMQKTGSAKLILNDSVTVSTDLTFNGGIIASSATNFFKIMDGVTPTGASASSHVNGYVRKVGNDAFTFPIGTDNTYNPVAMTAPGNVNDVFSAKYFQASPETVGDTSKHSPSIKRLSGCEYWDVNRVVGSSNVTLTFTYGLPCSGTGPEYINDPSKIHIAHWTGSTWEDLGNGGSTGTISGTITTAAAVNNFSPFTLGSTDVTLNPLPLQLITFTAVKQLKNVLVKWSTENEKDIQNFKVERASMNNQFVSAGFVVANNNSLVHNYSLIDASPANGINYYRLKISGRDGNIAYSKIVPVLFKQSDAISVYPNPAKDEIRILSSVNIETIEVADLSGRVVKKMIVNSGSRYSISGLQKGIYFIKVKDSEKTTATKLIVE